MQESTFNICERELPPGSIDPFLAMVASAGADLKLGESAADDELATNGNGGDLGD